MNDADELEEIRAVFQHGADDEYWEPGTTLAQSVAGLKQKLVAAYRELARLKRGDFTKEEFQNLCHNRHEKEGCTAKEFYDGCAQFQKKMFGESEQEIERMNGVLRFSETRILSLESERDQLRQSLQWLVSQRFLVPETDNIKFTECLEALNHSNPETKTPPQHNHGGEPAPASSAQREELNQ